MNPPFSMKDRILKPARELPASAAYKLDEKLIISNTKKAESFVFKTEHIIFFYFRTG